MTKTVNRRPLKSRDTSWARRLAALLARAGVRPDHVSAASLVFALAGALHFLSSGQEVGFVRSGALIAAGVCIQLRLLCNLLDGMVAVEHGRGGPYGPIWNELPDRVADVLLIASAGYGAQAAGAAHAVEVGWAASVLAVLTAYVRELGRVLTGEADFSGPMAKPHRMAALTLACAVSAAEPLWGWRGQSLTLCLWVILLGAGLTACRRLAHLAAKLAKSEP
jgi:phosphatidylglycerophosphate synthase